LVFLFLITAFCAGCTKSAEDSPNSVPNPAKGAGAPKSSGSAGEQVFAANGCGNCHTVGTKIARGGPDLSHVGAKGNSEQWLMDKIKNPQAANPRSRMPKYEGRISEAEMKQLASYLISLK
jgi:cytochrome c oxidase subunit 2